MFLWTTLTPTSLRYDWRQSSPDSMFGVRFGQFDHNTDGHVQVPFNGIVPYLRIGLAQFRRSTFGKLFFAGLFQSRSLIPYSVTTWAMNSRLTSEPDTQHTIKQRTVRIQHAIINNAFSGVHWVRGTERIYVTEDNLAVISVSLQPKGDM